MALFIPLMLVIGFFILFLIIHSLNPLYANIFLGFLFMWIYPNLNEKIGGYYMMQILFVLVVGTINTMFMVNQSSEGKIFGINFMGFKWLMVNIVIGVAVLVFMGLLQGRTSASILGVVSLSASAPLVISSSLYPMISGALGLIENRAIFTAVDFLKVIMEKLDIGIPLGILINMFLPLGIASVFFAVLHVSAYSYMVVSLIFAGIVAAVWITFYLLLDNSIVADFAHYWWNSILGLGKSLKIVTGTGSGLPVAGG